MVDHGVVRRCTGIGECHDVVGHQHLGEFHHCLHARREPRQALVIGDLPAPGAAAALERHDAGDRLRPHQEPRDAGLSMPGERIDRSFGKTPQLGTLDQRGAGGALPALRFEREEILHTVAFLRCLKDAGYVEGQNVAVEYRYADNQIQRLRAFAAEFVRRRVAVIVTSGSLAALAAKAATATIPVVFVTGSDPVAMGLVASLNRPGANVTGTAVFTAELAPKQLQLLRQVIPNASRIGVLADPASATTQFVVTDLQRAAPTLGLQIIVVYAGTDSDLEAAFANFSQQHASPSQKRCWPPPIR
jgi:hypothetical protein